MVSCQLQQSGVDEISTERLESTFDEWKMAARTVRRRRDPGVEVRMPLSPKKQKICGDMGQ